MFSICNAIVLSARTKTELLSGIGILIPVALGCLYAWFDGISYLYHFLFWSSVVHDQRIHRFMPSYWHNQLAENPCFVSFVTPVVQIEWLVYICDIHKLCSSLSWVLIIISFPTGFLQYQILSSLSKESLGCCHRWLRLGFSFDTYFSNEATGQDEDLSYSIISGNESFSCSIWVFVSSSVWGSWQTKDGFFPISAIFSPITLHHSKKHTN